MHFKIGTRGSKLALWQANFIQDKITQAGGTAELVIIETKGDKILDRALSKIGSKGVFTEELEDQLRQGGIDLAVHSAKDLPSDLGPDFEIVAFTERERPTDVLVSRRPLDPTSGEAFVIGTSSTRRVALLKAYFPHIQVVDMRGNLQTRLRKLDEGHCDALLLAYAGVHRMGYHEAIVHEFDLGQFTPAVGQGTVAVEVAVSLPHEKKEFLNKTCNHAATAQALWVERAYLNEMNGGCSVPVFGHVSREADGSLQARVGIVSLDGQQLIRHVETVLATAEPEQVGRKLARKLLEDGGREILDEIKQQLT